MADSRSGVSGPGADDSAAAGADAESIGASPTSCRRCGRMPRDDEREVLPLTWTIVRDDPNGEAVVCPECTREHVRAI